MAEWYGNVKATLIDWNEPPAVKSSYASLTSLEIELVKLV